MLIIWIYIIYNIIILYYGLNRQATNMCEFVVGVNSPKIGFELHALSISKLQKKWKKVAKKFGKSKMFDVSLSSKTVRLSELALRIEAARVFSSPPKLKF